MNKLKAAIEKLRSLKDALNKAKSAKECKQLQQQIDDLLYGKEGIQGHIKEISQMPIHTLKEEIVNAGKEISKILGKYCK